MKVGLLVTTYLLLETSVPAAPNNAGLHQMPFSFVMNKGQAENAVRYLADGPEFKAWFLDNKVVLEQGASIVQFQFVGSRKNPAIELADPLGAKANYLRGNDPAHWATNLPMFGSLRYHEVWPGIDLAFRVDEGHLIPEYIVAPGASPEQIRLRFVDSSDVPDLNKSGPVTKHGTSHAALLQDDRKHVTHNSDLFRTYADGTVGIVARAYDLTKPLRLNSAVLFSGLFGGASQTTITAMAVNSYYDTVVAGWTSSATLPAGGAAQSYYAGGVDAFVAEFSPAGGALVFCTYLGGSGDDRAFGVAVDSSNNTYITGWTSSSNFPVANAFQSSLRGTRDAFVTKLNPAGNSIVFSTYIGGSGVDAGYGIGLDSSGAPVIIGDSTSTNLPTTPGAFQSKQQGNQNVFVTKLASDGKTLQFLTYLGGSAVDHGAAISLDSSNSVFIGGSTYSVNFPVLNAFQSYSGGGQDGFLAKMSYDGTSLIFSTYYGGSGGSPGAPEGVNSIALYNGKVTAVGTTSSGDFPIVTGALQSTFGGGATDGFIGRIHGTTGALLSSTFLGGSSDDGINAVALDFDAFTYVAGYTVSSDFPTHNPLQSGISGGMDAFVAKTNLSRLIYSTYLGGSGNDCANAIALDSMTSVVVAGSTSSSNYAVKGNVGSYQGSTLSSFVTKLAPPYRAVLVSQPTFLYDLWHDTGFNGPSLTLNASTFGMVGDIPVAGDWDGSGTKRIGVFRNGVWYLDINGYGAFDTGVKTIYFGQAGDIPVVGDWDGSGRIKLGLYRQGTFILDMSGHLSGLATGVGDVSFPFGLPADIPVVSDWNQSGTSKVGVFRNGQWLVDYNGDQVFNGSDQTYAFGQVGDLPIVGDWDGSGLLKIGVYRRGLWILDYEGRNQLGIYSSVALYFSFGNSTYVPLVL